MTCVMTTAPQILSPVTCYSFIIINLLKDVKRLAYEYAPRTKIHLDAYETSAVTFLQYQDFTMIQVTST